MPVHVPVSLREALGVTRRDERIILMNMQTLNYNFQISNLACLTCNLDLFYAFFLISPGVGKPLVLILALPSPPPFNQILAVHSSVPVGGRGKKGVGP